MKDTIDRYLRLFERLTVSHRQGVKAPHKAILLLSVMSLIESGDQIGRQIRFSDNLKNRFSSIWAEYIGNSSVFNPDVAMPFWYLKNESDIWKLVPVSIEASHQLLRSTTASSLLSIRRFVKYAEIPEELYDLMCNPFKRAILAETLFENYIFV